MILSSTEPREDTWSGTIRRAQAGDRAALAEIFQSFSRRVGGLCHHLLHDRDRAEDAASEVFLRLRRSILTYDGSAAFERWLLRVAANHCIDVLRRRRLERRWVVEEGLAIEPPSPAASPLSLLLAKERRDEIGRAVADLAEEYRLPLVLRYYADLSYDEIAAELDLEKTQVAGRIFRAKQILRKMLEER